MTVPRPRPLRVADIAVDDRWVFATDEVYPVVAEFDRQTGDLERLVWWDLADGLRAREASAALLVHGDELWVSSPAAGGIVRIDLATGGTTIVALDADPGPMTAAGDTVWVVAHVDFQHLLDDHSPDLVWYLPRPVWRVVDGRPERVGLDGDVSDLRSLSSGELLVALRRVDGIVTERDYRGDGPRVAYREGTVLVRGTPPGPFTELGTLVGHRFFVDGERYWFPTYDDRQWVLLELDPATGSLTPLPGTIAPSVIVGGIALTVHRVYPSYRNRQTVRCEALSSEGGGTDPQELEPQREIDEHAGGAVSRGIAWFIANERDALVWIDPSSATIGEFPVSVDLAPSAPAAIAPPDLDLDQFEQEQLAGLQRVFAYDYPAPEFRSGRAYGFDSVELRGRFPDTYVVGRYWISARPGIRFAHRWDLYDELGNPQDYPIANVYLDEAIDCWLPEPADCHPDADGLVWF